MARLSTATKQPNWRRAAPFAAIAAIVGAVVIVIASAAGTPIAFEAETGALAGAASITSVTGQSGSGAVKFGAAASPTPTGGCKVATPNVADGPDPWGGCFPGPLSTGVPAGTTLATYSGCSGGYVTITAANTVIDSKTVNCDVVIQAAGVMIKNSKINGGLGLDTDNASSSGWSFTLQDSEVDIGVVQLAAVAAGNMTIIRSNVHGGQTAVQCEEKSVNCVVQDSYLHGQQLPVNANWHLGGMLSDGGGPITVTHNYLICDQPATYGTDGGCTGDFNMIPNFGTAHNITASNNLFGANASSAYCTYGGEKPSSPYPHGNHIVYQNNIFQKGSTGHCAAFGPVADFDVMQPGNVWTNNVYSDGTAIVCKTTDDCM